MTLFKSLTLLLALLLCINIQSQVTIGSTITPVQGALLDLKQKKPLTPGGATASKGMGLPRVIINDLAPDNPTALATSIGSTGNWDLGEHIGLMVYHTDKCTFGGKGVYIWTGEEWQPLHEQNIYTPALNQTYFDLPSGWDGRGAIPATPQNLSVTWQSETNPTWAIAAAPGSTAVTLTSPITGTTGGGSVTTSPFNLAISPAAMTIANPGQPWQSSESRVTFTNLATDCGQQNFVTLNQTNYVLQVYGKFIDTHIIYMSPTTGQFFVRGNAAWKTTVSDPNGIFNPLSTNIPASGGMDLKNGTVSDYTNTTYDMSQYGKYYTASITFSDTASVKRFNDIAVSFLNCINSEEPNMNQWAERAGFPGVPTIQTSSDAQEITTLKRDTPDPVTGIAWHRDQDGNIFLSGRFGYEDAPANTQERRWMITNLAAKNYVSPANIRSGDDKYIGVTMPVAASAAQSYTDPLWCYPNTPTIATTYTNSPRIGLLYNWAAATNGRGRFNMAGTQVGANGQLALSDGETAAAADPQLNKIQGICPNGWHVPSDREWTYLEQQISDNTSLYSNLPNDGAIIALAATGYRNTSPTVTTQGAAMKDVCPAPNNPTYTNGSSNAISTAVHGGFSAMLVGAAYRDANNSYGTNAFFWSASSNGIGYSWARGMVDNASQVARDQPARDFLTSVRCKKDN